jgi:hypothetical protein
MRKSSHKTPNKSKKRTTKKTLPPHPIVGFGEPPQSGHGFMKLLLQRVSWAQVNGLNERKSPAGRPAHKLSRGQLLVGVIFHYTLTCSGTLAEHLLLLMGLHMSESSLSQRRQALPFSVFAELLKLLLRSIAGTAEKAFYKGLRLAALDAVEFNLCNTPQINGRLKKGCNQSKKPAAFAKLRCAVLLEVMLHNPLGARLGLNGESEWQLAQGLLEHCPAKCLLLGDRLYGCAAFVIGAHKVLEKIQSFLLVRVKLGIKAKRQKVLKDGSCLVEISSYQSEGNHKNAETMVVREIRATLRRKGCQSVHVRFWTTLLDEKKYPAEELVRLYASRWEHELYFRELKRELRVNKALQSQTVETAAQELAAMIIGSSLIAHERSKLPEGEQSNHRVSFIKTAELLEPLWLAFSLCGDILTELQKQQMAARFYWMASQLTMAKKRQRSCPRVVTQSRKRWPRKSNQKESNGPLSIRIMRRAS